MSDEQTNPPIAFVDDFDPIPAETSGNTEALSRETVFARRETYPEWLREMIEKLENLATLQENWDSYGAGPIDKRSIKKARDLIGYLAAFIAVDCPAVAGTPDGHVGFSWDEGSWSLNAKILPDGRIKYVYLDERDATKDRETTTRNWSDLLDLLTQWPEALTPRGNRERAEAEEMDDEEWVRRSSAALREWMDKNPF